MSSAAPPAADDDEAYIFVDHRDEESSIVEQVSERLASEHKLSAREDGDDLFVTYCDQEYRIPLTISRHDRYIAISSLAELLKDGYRFFVLTPWEGDDTHGLLVVPLSEAQAWGPPPEHLTPLQLGFDYFGQISIPYLNHEDSTPNFATESESARSTSNAMSQLLISAVLAGKVDAKASAELAKAAMAHPKIQGHPDFPKNMSEAEIAAEIQKAMKEALEDPEVVGHRREMGDAMRELRNLTTPNKPWWKFW